MPITTIFLYFIAYSFLGWGCESIYKSIFQKKLINTGFLYGPLCPVYGLGALLILYLLLPFQANPLLVFVLGVLTTSTLEYITSVILEVLFHMSWWDYSKHKFNIHGRVCLLNSTLFGILTLVVTYIIHPEVVNLVAQLSQQQQLIVAIILFVMVVVDCSVTVGSLLGMNKALMKVHDYLHTIFENAASNVNEGYERISKENEIIMQKLLKKRESLQKAFPNIKHTRFDISGKSISELIVKAKNNNKKK